MSINNIISTTTGATLRQCSAIIKLLDEGATVPFISRYRKEQTSSADEVLVLAVKNEYERIQEIQRRKERVIATITEQGRMTPELLKSIEECFDLSKLEDIYLPYKPKRRTRAQIARERGVEPLATIIFEQRAENIERLSEKYINDELPDSEAVLAAANDIIAEWVSEDIKVRERLRRLYTRTAMIRSTLVKGKDEEAAKYRDYFSFEGELRRQPSHRLLAIFRAQSEGFIRVDIEVDSDEAVNIIDNVILRRGASNGCRNIVEDAIEDSYKRLIKPSLDTEITTQAKERADKEAIEIFAQNLRQLLLSPPLGAKNILAIDPGFRTGCKVVCINASGDFIHNDTIYPHEPQRESEAAIKKLLSMVERYKIEAIAIGDGTASRPTEALVKGITFAHPVEIYVVSEDGASIYSASSMAREEFPTLDVTVRGAISIGRRLLDPLSELVKIEPKSIGVGQYQHDVDQSQLKRSLDDVVESCVNSVGVNLNSASYHLLSYVSGIGATLSKRIVEYRSANGDFDERRDLLKVPRLGAKVYEQCAGFLRIKGGKNPLDGSAVHPESYPIVARMAKDLGCKVEELLTKSELRERITPERYTTDKVGMETITDILAELKKPGLDPRSPIESFEFAAGVLSIDDLCEGMELAGIVTNITAFGAFVDIGVKQDGLVHISQLADRFVSSVGDVVKLQQRVKVRVTEVDRVRGRIALSMRGL